MKKKIAAIAALVLALPYIGAAGYIKLQEPHLVFRADLSRSRVEPALPAGLQQVAVPTEGGQSLAAVLALPPDDSAPTRWILHLHGNADTAFSELQLRHVQRLAALGYGVLAPDTRGMGRTPGTPSEPSFHADAEAALRFIRERGVPVGRIVVWGHSLGSGPATALAARHPVAGLVLFGAFTSVPARGAELYPWLPVDLLATIRFDNAATLPQVRVPVFITHAEADTLVPYAHGERLFAVANEPKQLLRLSMKLEDGFGGHVTALYDQLELLEPLLEPLLPAATAGQ